MSYPRLAFMMLPILGVALATGACGAPLAVTGASYAADGGLLAASDKTAADHLISMVSKQDCAMWRVVRGRAVCKAREGDQDPYKVDYNDPQRMVAEDGTHYGPPLRAAPDAPPTSWDAAVYKTAPPEPAPPVPVTAVAEGSPSPAPVAGKPAKPRKHSVRKPSRSPAAPAS